MERLILEVQKNPTLYDKKHALYKNASIKDDIWKAIGSRVGMTGAEARKKWCNLRDAWSFNRRKTQQAMKCGAAGLAKTPRPYKFARIMNFLIPYTTQRKRSSLNLELDHGTVSIGGHSENDDNIRIKDELEDYEEYDGVPEEEEDDDDDDEEEDAGAQGASQPDRNKETSNATTVFPPYATPSRGKGTKRKAETHNDSGVCSMEYPRGVSQMEYPRGKLSKDAKAKVQDKGDEDDSDDIDTFFRSIASTVRKMPPGVASEVKFKVHQVVHQAEMEALYPRSYPHDCPPHGSRWMQ